MPDNTTTTVIIGPTANLPTTVTEIEWKQMPGPVESEPTHKQANHERKSVRNVVAYLLLLLILDLAAIIVAQKYDFGQWTNGRLILMCGLLGGVGGLMYCLQAVYRHTSVKDDWKDGWLPWYFLRPLVSHLGGTISWVFLKAGLLVLNASSQTGGTTDAGTDASSQLGFYALAFIAGFNVDKFMDKLEDIAHSVWGVEKSGLAKEKAQDQNTTAAP